MVGASLGELERESRANSHLATIKGSFVGHGVRDAAIICPDDGRADRNGDAGWTEARVSH